MTKQHVETRWMVCRDYYNDRGDNLRDEFPVMYGTESEAVEMMNRLNNGSDVTYFNPADEEAGFLYVDRYDLVFDGKGGCYAV